MENEIKLVNNVEGSVVSDKMLNKVDIIQEQAKQIGVLQGEITSNIAYHDNEIESLNTKLDEAQTKVRVEFVNGVDVKKSPDMIRDDWAYSVYLTEHKPQSISRITVDKVQLKELASAAAIGEAKKKEDAADEKLKNVKQLEQWAKDTEKGASKLVDDMRKTQKDATAKAVEFAEKSNIKTIDSLTLEIKSLMKENDLMVDERNNLAIERDLTIEAMDAQARLFRNRIDILERPNKKILASVNSKLNSMWFQRRIRKLQS